jgi:BatD DUF11 like domain
MKKSKIVLFFIVSFFLQGFLFFGEPPIVSSLSKGTVATGEVFTYTVTVIGSFNKPSLTLPEFKSLKVISQRQSKEYIKIKKKNTLKTTITFSLVSHRPGIIKLGSALLQYGKRRFKSKGMVVKIIGLPLNNEKKLDSYIANSPVL